MQCEEEDEDDEDEDDGAMMERDQSAVYCV